MASPVLKYEKKGRIAYMTMNRPEAMNSLNRELLEALSDAFDNYKNDDDLWVCILTGAGDRAFSAGADLKDQVKSDEIRLKTGQAPKLSLSRRFPQPGTTRDFFKPIIAAVNGYALAGGWWLAQASDIRIVAEDARLGVTEARWNISAPWICDLTRIIGIGHAIEICITCEFITARRAYEIGFANAVVPRAQLMEEANRWAEKILTNAPMAVRLMIETLYRAHNLTTEQGNALCRALQAPLHISEDIVEGRRAFVEKRKPQFKNR